MNQKEPEVLKITTVQSRNRTVLPVEVRKKLNLNEGDDLLWAEDGGEGIRLYKAVFDLSNGGEK